ncbi:ABC transporter ATP-binding protein [Petrachloros mirabilis]
MAEVKLEQIGKRFGDHEVLSNLDLTIGDGEFFTIVGPSGCGKSTLLNILAGLDKPTAGRIRFDGEDVTRQEPRERDVALVFQSYALYPHMTVRDNLSFPLLVTARSSKRDSRSIQEEVRRVAGMLGLEQLLDRWPRQLSGGQRQRVALGRALIRQPRVFLLDEPLSNLDAQLRSVMRAELRRLHDQLGTTMIYVTHDQTEAMTLADRVAVLDRGRIQQVGAPRELYDRPDTMFVAGFIGYPQINLLDAVIEDNRVRSGTLDVPLRTVESLMPIKEGASVKIGIRPEHLSIMDKPAAGALPHTAETRIEGTLRLIEHTGSQAWATVETGSGSGLAVLIGHASHDLSLKQGQVVTGIITNGPLHLFELETGRVIARIPLVA